MSAAYTLKFHFGYGWNLGEDEGVEPLDFTTKSLDAVIPDSFATDISTTMGVEYGYRGGVVFDDNLKPVRIEPGKITLPYNSICYVERDRHGVVSFTTTGFRGMPYIPMARVTTNDIEISGWLDWRPVNGNPEVKSLVTSVFGRIGDVIAMDGDYLARQIRVAELVAFPGLTNVQQVLEALDVKITNHPGLVRSVFGRLGDVTKNRGDYDAGDITVSTINEVPDNVTDDVQGILEYLAGRVTTVVNTFKGRSGDVIPQSGDYTGLQITFTPPVGMISTNTQLAIEELFNLMKNMHTGVSSFKGREGAVIPMKSDYSADLIVMNPDIIPGVDNVQDTLEAMWALLNAGSGGGIAITTADPIYKTMPKSGALSISQALNAAGGIQPYQWSVTGGTLSGASISNGSLIASVGAAGTYTATISVNDSTTPTAKTASKTLTFSIASAVQITNNASYTNQFLAQSGNDVALSLTAADGRGPYTWELVTSTLPGASISGNVLHSSIGSAGSYSAEVRVTDANGATDTKTIAFTVTISSQLAIGNQDNYTYNFTNPTGNDVNLPLLGVGGSGSYTWSIVSGNLPGASILSGSLRSSIASNGTFTCRVKLTDSSTAATVEKTITFAVTVPAAAPTITTAASFTDSGYNNTYNLSLPLTAIGGSAPYSWSIITGVDTTQSIAWSPVGGTLTATINTTNNQSRTVSVRVRCTANDGQHVEKVISITVNYVQALTVTAESPSIVMGLMGGGGQQTFAISVAGGSGGNVVTVSKNGTPPIQVGGSLDIALECTLTLDSASEYTVEWTDGTLNASPTLTVSVTDSMGHSASSTFTVALSRQSNLILNIAPKSGGPFNIGDNSTKTIALSASGGSGSGYVFSLLNVSPASAAFSLIGSNVSYNPSDLPNSSATYTLTLKVVDSQGNQTTDTATVQMTAVSAPVLTVSSGSDTTSSLPYTAYIPVSASGGSGSYSFSIVDAGNMPSPQIVNYGGGKAVRFTANSYDDFYCTVKATDNTTGLFDTEPATYSLAQTPFAFVGKGSYLTITGSPYNFTPSYENQTNDANVRLSVLGTSNCSAVKSYNGSTGTDRIVITPNSQGVCSITIDATDTGYSPNQSDTGTFYFTYVPPLQITTNATNGYTTPQGSRTYTGELALSAVGGYPAGSAPYYTWSLLSVTGGNVASNVTIDAANSKLTFSLIVPDGMASTTSTARVRCTDQQNQIVEKNIALTAAASSTIVITNTDQTVSLSGSGSDTEVSSGIPLTCTGNIGPVTWTIESQSGDFDTRASISGSTLTIFCSTNYSTGVYNRNVTIKATDGTNITTKTLSIAIDFTKTVIQAPTVSNFDITVDSNGYVTFSALATCDPSRSIAGVQILGGGVLLMNLALASGTNQSGTFSGLKTLTEVWNHGDMNFTCVVVDNAGSSKSSNNIDKTVAFAKPQITAFTANGDIEHGSVHSSWTITKGSQIPNGLSGEIWIETHAYPLISSISTLTSADTEWANYSNVTNGQHTATFKLKWFIGGTLVWLGEANANFTFHALSNLNVSLTASYSGGAIHINNVVNIADAGNGSTYSIEHVVQAPPTYPNTGTMTHYINTGSLTGPQSFNENYDWTISLTTGGTYNLMSAFYENGVLQNALWTTFDIVAPLNITTEDAGPINRGWGTLVNNRLTSVGLNAEGGNGTYTWSIIDAGGTDATIESGDLLRFHADYTDPGVTYNITVQCTSGAQTDTAILEIFTYYYDPKNPGCVPAGTDLLMADGNVINIENAVTGMVVQAFDQYDFEPTEARITDVLVYENRELCEIVTEFGSIITSLDHRVWSHNTSNWIRAISLHSGDVTKWYKNGEIVNANVLEVSKLDRNETVYHVHLDVGHIFVAGNMPAHNEKPIT